MINLEIERKFLVAESYKHYINEKDSIYIKQGYISKSENKTIRVRIINETEAYMTIKGKDNGEGVPEIEFQIPLKEGQEIYEKYAPFKIQKIRHHYINFDNLVWEIDEFLGNNLGLVIAEVELKDKEQEVNLPIFIKKEITGDVNFFNSNLAKR